MDVSLVEVGRQVEAQEDGPDDGEGPYVGVRIPRKRCQELGGLDLRIFDKSSHVGGALSGAGGWC